MTAFPKRAAFGQRIFLAELRRRGLPPRFAAFAKSLVWAYKLAPGTINLPATPDIREIEVMDLSLKDKGQAPRPLASLVAAIDKLIPNPLLFRLSDEDGNPLGFAFNLKTSGGALHGDSDVFRLFRTTKTVIPLPKGAASLEALLLRFAAAVAGVSLREGETLRELDERHYRLESLRARQADLAKKLSIEVHLDRKYALAKEKLGLKREIALLSSLNPMEKESLT